MRHTNGRIAAAALSLSLVLAGCQGAQVAHSPAPAETPVQTAHSEYTAQGAMSEFEDWAAGQGMEVQCADCVLAGDGNVQAVVLYTDQATNTSCNLAWLDAKDAGWYTIGVVANQSPDRQDFIPADGGNLAYQGQGQVSLDVEETATGDRYRYTVSCGEEGPEQGFTVETQALSRSEG